MTVAAFRLTAYLARLGLGGPPPVDRDGLTTLHRAHVARIPYETIDPRLDRPVSLDLSALQAKLIDQHRGGYCFEQNILFCAALQALGFSVTPLVGRVRWLATPHSPLTARTHMMLKVELPEGVFLADVGFGVCLIDEPLALKAGIEQSTAMGRFRLHENNATWTLEAAQPVSEKYPSGWRTMYLFTLEPAEHADLELANWFTASHPQSMFRHTLLLERVTAETRYKLVNRRYVLENAGGAVRSERVLTTAGEYGAILRDTFSVVPPVAVEDIFNCLLSESP